MYVTMYGQRRRCGYATNDSQAGVHRAPPEPSAQGTRPQVPRHGSRSDPSGHRPRSRADGNAGSRHRGVEADRALHRPATVATSAPRQADVEAGPALRALEFLSTPTSLSTPTILGPERSSSNISTLFDGMSSTDTASA